MGNIKRLVLFPCLFSITWTKTTQTNKSVKHSDTTENPSSPYFTVNVFFSVYNNKHPAAKWPSARSSRIHQTQLSNGSDQSSHTLQRHGNRKSIFVPVSEANGSVSHAQLETNRLKNVKKLEQLATTSLIILIIINNPGAVSQSVIQPWISSPNTEEWKITMYLNTDSKLIRIFIAACTISAENISNQSILVID